jgi:hypothetical protein
MITLLIGVIVYFVIYAIVTCIVFAIGALIKFALVSVVAMVIVIVIFSVIVALIVKAIEFLAKNYRKGHRQMLMKRHEQSLAADKDDYSIPLERSLDEILRQ